MTLRPEVLEKARKYKKIFSPYLLEMGGGLVPDAPKEAVEAFEKFCELLPE